MYLAACLSIFVAAYLLNVLAITTLFWTGLYMASPILSSNGEAYRHFVMGRIREIPEVEHTIELHETVLVRNHAPNLRVRHDQPMTARQTLGTNSDHRL